MRKIIIIALLLLSASCAPKFSCKDTWSGTRCSNMTDVYEARHDEVISREDVKKSVWEGKAPEKDALKRRSPVSDNDAVTDNIVTNLQVDKELPLRIPTAVLEIWIAPYEDADGDLHKPETIFMEVDNRRGKWLFGEKPRGVNRVLKPVEIEAPKDAAKQTEIAEKNEKKSPLQQKQQDKAQKIGGNIINGR